MNHVKTNEILRNQARRDVRTDSRKPHAASRKCASVNFPRIRTPRHRRKGFPLRNLPRQDFRPFERVSDLLTPYDFRVMESLVASVDWYFRRVVHPLWYLLVEPIAHERAEPTQIADLPPIGGFCGNEAGIRQEVVLTARARRPLAGVVRTLPRNPRMEPPGFSPR